MIRRARSRPSSSSLIAKILSLQFERAVAAERSRRIADRLRRESPSEVQRDLPRMEVLMAATVSLCAERVLPSARRFLPWRWPCRRRARRRAASGASSSMPAARRVVRHRARPAAPVCPARCPVRRQSSVSSAPAARASAFRTRAPGCFPPMQATRPTCSSAARRLGHRPRPSRSPPSPLLAAPGAGSLRGASLCL